MNYNYVVRGGLVCGVMAPLNAMEALHATLLRLGFQPKLQESERKSRVDMVCLKIITGLGLSQDS